MARYKPPYPPQTHVFEQVYRGQKMECGSLDMLVPWEMALLEGMALLEEVLSLWA